MTKIIALKKIKVQPKFKYAIIEMVGQLPHRITKMDVVKHLEANNITPDQYYADRKIAFGSDKTIPEDRLMIYAMVLECSTDDLRNYEIKAKPIRDFGTVSKSKIKSGLACLAFLMLLTGCGDDFRGWAQPKKHTGIIDVLKIDSCQYIIYDGTYKAGIIHKANCSNPVHACAEYHCVSSVPFSDTTDTFSY